MSGSDRVAQVATSACDLCGSDKAEVVSERDRHGGALRTVLCTGCGLIRNDPVPDQADLDRFYGSTYREDYKGASEPRLRQIWRNFDRTARHLQRFRDIYASGGASGGQWLDLGCGSGEFLYLARSLGAGIDGIEPHAGYARYCAERLDLPVVVGTLQSCTFGPQSFDLIRLSHVLEHMRDPVGTLAVLRGWLRPGGILYVEVPDIEHEAQAKVRGRMFHYGHIHNFNPVTLRATARKAGLEELPEAAQRSAGTTGVFLRASGGVSATLDPELLACNAVRMRDAMARHNARLVPRPPKGSAAGRFISSIAARLRDVLSGARLRSPRAIADAAALALRRAMTV